MPHSNSRDGSAEFAVDRKELPRIKRFVREMLAVLGKDTRAANRIMLVVEELAVNVITHAESREPRFFLEIAGLENGGVAVSLKDSGKPFDPLTADRADTESPLAERKPGGLGIHLVQANVSRCSYERRNGWNMIRLEIT